MVQPSIRNCKEARRALAESRRRCDMALELLGERNERIEQLEEDIEDMKGIFRAQLENCVNQLQQAQQDLARVQNGAAGAGEETRHANGAVPAQQAGGQHSPPGSTAATPSKKPPGSMTKHRN